jgi:hypothetical protein
MSIFVWFRRWKGPELAEDIVDPVLGPLSHVSVGVWEGNECEFNGRRIDVEISGDHDGANPELIQIFDRLRQDFASFFLKIKQAFTEADLIPADEAPLIVGHISIFHSSNGGTPCIEISHFADHPLEEHPYVATIVDGLVSEVWRG